MAITINFTTKVISVPQADLTLIGGTLYELDTETVFRQPINALMASNEGIPFVDPILHNTTVTVAGTTFARTIEIINGYSVTFTPDAQYTVRLAGSNNNIFDVENNILNQNQVQIISQNSAGLIQISTGSGLSGAQDTKLTRIHALLDVIEGSFDHAEIMRVLLSAAAGLSSGHDADLPKYRNVADDKDRISATTTSDGRTIITLDVTP